MQALRFRMIVPTYSEIQKTLLYFINHEQDFSEILEKCNQYTLGMDALYEISSIFICSTIALAALFLTLEDF